ncbi:ABC transporter permease [Paenibacillus sp. MY03]|uniref:carbohydrate ABC transporter permease n=1 Tax=unclassified Paenibacillus TaxID=185978 RepID=UPI000B3C4404|nr:MULTISPECIES: carbohydrate ABC transporter permease [unclassified Paenibacillus]OUS77199.1 ABC transporter permease [Paenibacillus sp. MY03]QNK57367.1 carbohydrate ABC transporter permease [Paenibacillus sp. PAMC21692]
MISSRESRGDLIFRYTNATILGLISIVMLIPFVKVLATSFSGPHAVGAGQVYLWPVQFTWASWKYILGLEPLWSSFFITLFATVAGTFLSLLITALFAYPLSKNEFKLAKILMFMIVITMIFRYPIIPYFLSLRSYGLYNSIWVLIIPYTVTAFNLIIMRTFFKGLPKELEEAAQMEGCGYFQLLFRIVLPSSQAVIATLGIFYAVGIWNQFMIPLLFIEDQSLYPLQLKLREYIVNVDMEAGGFGEILPYSNETLRSATIIFATIPILLVYPFLQKYFVKGAMLGSVK